MDSRLPENVDTRQEQRERKLKKKRERIAKHGRNLAIIYKEAIIKRIAKAKNKAKGGSPRG